MRSWYVFRFFLYFCFVAAPPIPIPFIKPKKYRGYRSYAFYIERTKNYIDKEKAKLKWLHLNAFNVSQFREWERIMESKCFSKMIARKLYKVLGIMVLLGMWCQKVMIIKSILYDIIQSQKCYKLLPFAHHTFLDKWKYISIQSFSFARALWNDFEKKHMKSARWHKNHEYEYMNRHDRWPCNCIQYSELCWYTQFLSHLVYV